MMSGRNARSSARSSERRLAGAAVPGPGTRARHTDDERAAGPALFLDAARARQRQPDRLRDLLGLLLLPRQRAPGVLGGPDPRGGVVRDRADVRAPPRDAARSRRVAPD